MRAKLKNARISPKKMTLLAKLVHGKKVSEGLAQLKFTPKKAAKILTKIIGSALANATNNRKQDEKKLIIKSIIITKGESYKRGLPVSRGRYAPLRKRNSNITINLGIVENIEKPERKDSKKISKSLASANETVTT